MSPAQQKTLRQKMAAMAERGTEHEAKVARAWLEAHPVRILSAEEIITADDSEFGPTAAEVDAALASYYKRQR